MSAVEISGTSRPWTAPGGSCDNAAASANAGRVAAYGALLRDVWRGRGAGGTDRVRSCVRNLRRKLGDDPEEPRYIFNVRGVGYRMPQPGKP